MKDKFINICVVILCLVLSLCLYSCEQSTSQNKHNRPNADIKPPTGIPPAEAVTIAPDKWEEWEQDKVYMITYSARLSYNNHVGNSWGYGLEYYGEYIESGSQVSCAKIAKGIIVTVYAIEYDNVTDYGQAYASFDSLDVGEKETKEVAVIVRENRGRYAGSTAQWIFEITVERIS